MPWGIQKIQQIQDFLGVAGNLENPEYPGNILDFTGCRWGSIKSRKSRLRRISWMLWGIQKIQKIQ